MKTKTQGNPTGGIDMVQPIVEIMEIFISGLVKFLTWFISWAIKRILKIQEDETVLERKNLFCKKITDREDSLGIDTQTRKVVLLNDINFIKHSFIVGASGFGKTNLISILQEHSLRKGIPVIFFDPKGDLEALNTFLELCDSYNKTCHVFSEFYSSPVRLNPLLEGSANQVADRIMRAFDWSEQYYKDVACRALLRALRDLEKDGQHFSLKNIHARIEESGGGKDLVGLMAKMESILESDFSRLLNGTKDDLTLSKIRQEGSCLYLGLSTQGYGETAMSIGKLFLGELLHNSYFTLRGTKEGKMAPVQPVSIFFDEFGSMVTPQFIELQNKCRNAGMQLTMAVQTASDIDKVNPDLTRQIIENASNLFVMKQRLDEGASLFSKAIGTVHSSKMTYMTEEGEKSSRGSIREINRLKSHPDIIKNLGVGQCVLLRHAPSKVQLINIRKRKTNVRVFNGG